jgi:purine-binding chemotaxis protein CheW
MKDNQANNKIANNQNVNNQTASNQAAAESFILFELANATYAARSRSVQQLEMIEQITPVPNAPPAVEGVVFSRGQVIPAINLRVRFGFEKTAHDLRTRLIIVNAQSRLIGLIVDSAREFISIPSNAIQPPNEAISGLKGKYLEAIATIDERIVLILNLDEIINLAEDLTAAPENA